MIKIYKFRLCLLLFIVLLALCSCGGKGTMIAENETGGNTPSPTAQTKPSPEDNKNGADTQKEQPEAKEQNAGAAAVPKGDLEQSKPKANSEAAPIQASQNSAAPKEENKKTQEPNPTLTKKTVTISIADGERFILGNTEAEFSEGETVYDILKKQTRANKIQMEIRGGAANAYICGIDNLYEFDEGPESGWIYSVNGKFISSSCSSIRVKQGDVIAWRYTRKLVKDIWAGLN